MINPQNTERPNPPLIGQPLNPFRLFTGIFSPEALVRSSLVSPRAKVASLARYAGEDGRCFPAVERQAQDIGAGNRRRCPAGLPNNRSGACFSNCRSYAL